METWVTKTYGPEYEFLLEKIISMGGVVSYPSKAGNFNVRLRGCNYRLDNNSLSCCMELLPYIFGEAMRGERKG